jgi:hypothetical protein
MGQLRQNPSFHAMSNTTATPKLIKQIGYSHIYDLPGDPEAFFYEAGMMIDADGSPFAYNPVSSKGLDALANAGSPGDWFALVTENGEPDGSPIVQSDVEPAPGYYISTTALIDPRVSQNSPLCYVNSQAINYFVLPGESRLGAELGDIGVVIYTGTGKTAYAVYADVGPAEQIGEGSIALANALGISASPRTGGVGHGVIYIVFRGSRKGWPLTQAEIDATGAELFAKWGGMAQVKNCYPDAHVC